MLKRNDNKFDAKRPNLFQLIVNQIYSILQYFSQIGEKIASYFAYLQRPGINVAVSILGLIILVQIYRSLAKSYQPYRSTLFQFCISSWAYILIIFIIIYAIQEYYSSFYSK